MTIAENMALADNKGKIYGLRMGKNKARLDFYREQLSQLGLGLEDKMDVKVGVLSGGQRQAIDVYKRQGLDEFVNHRFSINKIFHVEHGTVAKEN